MSLCGSRGIRRGQKAAQRRKLRVVLRKADAVTWFWEQMTWARSAAIWGLPSRETGVMSVSDVMLVSGGVLRDNDS